MSFLFAAATGVRATQLLASFHVVDRSDSILSLDVIQTKHVMSICSLKMFF